MHEVLIRTSSGRRSIKLDDDWCNSLSVPVGDNGKSVLLFVATWIALLADSPLKSSRKPLALYHRFLNGIRDVGVKSIVNDYSNLAHELVKNHSLMGADSSIGAWIDGFRDTPVFFESIHYYRTGDIEVLKYLYAFLNFGKKLEFADEAFNEAAFRSWLDVEKRLDDLVLDDVDVSSLKTILSVVLPTFTIDDFRPKFGPGSVMEKGVRGRIDKLRSLQFDPYVDRFIFRGHIGMYGCGGDHGLDVSKVIPDPSHWSPACGVSARDSRLMFVPKNLKVARSICMEPNTLMFFQQGIMREFLRCIKGSLLSRFVDINDQARNRFLAQAGSASSEIDTIDLSSASDSVSLDLVRKIFPASWLIPMLATRSSRVMLPDGSVRVVRKFAPMGSALCFPTQCIIFASVCIYAACLHAYDSSCTTVSFSDWLAPSKVTEIVGLFSNDPGYYLGAYQPLAVYGDDICVDRRLTPIIESILSRLGFVVNVGKSFVGSDAFRESCGGYYLGGHDITPTYFRIRGVARKLCARHVVSHVHLINECFERSWHNAYRFLRHSITTWECSRRYKNKASARNAIPYVTDSSRFGILAVAAPNTHLESRYNTAYQRDEVRSWTISHEVTVDPGELLSLVDKYEHVRWWASRYGDNSTGFTKSVSRSDTGGAGLRWRWIPA